jgi:hypothetical protein
MKYNINLLRKEVPVNKLHDIKPEQKKPEVKKSVDSPVEISSPEICGLNIVIGSLRMSGYSNESKEIKALYSKIDEIRKGGEK